MFFLLYFLGDPERVEVAPPLAVHARLLRPPGRVWGRESFCRGEDVPLPRWEGEGLAVGALQPLRHWGHGVPRDRSGFFIDFVVVLRLLPLHFSCSRCCSLVSSLSRCLCWSASVLFFLSLSLSSLFPCSCVSFVVFCLWVRLLFSFFLFRGIISFIYSVLFIY